MNPRAVLQERYPEADFWPYFSFLEACRGTEKGLDTHEHHICPRAQFPEYEKGFPENLITLKLTDHSWAHRLLELACGIKAPSTTWIESQTWTPERQAKAVEAGRKGGRKGGLIGGPIAGRMNVESGHIAALNSNSEHQARAGRKGGVIGGRVTAAIPGHFSKAGCKGGRISGRSNIEKVRHLANHGRWHVRRGIKSLTCKLCRQSLKFSGRNKGEKQQ
jgi:general stress protein YciG